MTCPVFGVLPLKSSDTVMTSCKEGVAKLDHITFVPSY